MGLAPRHRVDHTPIYILADDSAWDLERVNYEMGVIRRKVDLDPARPVPWTKLEDHPWTEYHQGRSRAALEPMRGYLLGDPPTPPVEFKFRRMRLREWTRVQDRLRGAHGAGCLLAISIALTEVSGLEFSRGGGEGGPLDDDDLERLRELVGDDHMSQLGAIAVSISRTVLEAEKKP